MKKYLLFLPFLFLFGCNDYASISNYNFSDSQNACAFIFYNVQDTPALVLENKTVNYDFNDENIIATSSSADFAINKFNGGFSTHNYFNADGSKIDLENEPPFFTGYKTIDETEYIYNVIHFNDKEECFSSDPFEDDKIFTELINKIYKN